MTDTIKIGQVVDTDIMSPDGNYPEMDTAVRAMKLIRRLQDALDVDMFKLVSVTIARADD